MKVSLVGAYNYNPNDNRDIKAAKILKKQCPKYMEVLKEGSGRILITDKILNGFNSYVMDKAYGLKQIPVLSESEFKIFSDNEGVSAIDIKSTNAYKKANFGVLKRFTSTIKRGMKYLI